MNIFALDINPFKSAAMMSDKHIAKMILESGQLLSTAHRFLDGHCELTYVKRKSHKHSLKSHWKLDDEREDILYKATSIHHPCSKWVRESSENYEWLLAHFVALNIEYTNRFGKVHKTYSTLFETLLTLPKNIPTNKQTQFVQCFDDKYKHLDPIQGYRNYYSAEKLFTKTDAFRFHMLSK